MAEAAQLPLDLGHRPARGREDFLLAPSNREAVLWLDRWPDWPAPALVLHGPPGSGKSHLAEVWRGRAEAAFFPRETLAVAGLGERLEGERAVILEDADRGVEEEALLHLYNMLAERRGHLLLTARTPPARWPLALADLRSRLVAAPAAALGAPDDVLLGAVLVKLFADRQLRADAELIAYLLPRMERSFAGAARLAAALDAESLAARRPLTLPLARAVLEALAREGS